MFTGLYTNRCRWTLQRISQQPIMIDPCFNWLNTLPSDESLHNIRLYLHRKKFFLQVLVTEVARGMLKVNHVRPNFGLVSWSIPMLCILDKRGNIACYWYEGKMHLLFTCQATQMSHSAVKIRFGPCEAGVGSNICSVLWWILSPPTEWKDTDLSGGQRWHFMLARYWADAGKSNCSPRSSLYTHVSHEAHM